MVVFQRSALLYWIKLKYMFYRYINRLIDGWIDKCLPAEEKKNKVYSINNAMKETHDIPFYFIIYFTQNASTNPDPHVFSVSIHYNYEFDIYFVYSKILLK